ncbi:Hypothetical predicted protein [Pelobates cultripes]|uniref:Uncharacterized protein n=1 Tax=Pelobates cultripes TaxID=61616 RepID=A0AAD1VLW5_PELCU|nr:Hypothetical predicted protein [Pelobates cultripes]
MASLSDRLSYSSSETSIPDMEELAAIARRKRADIPAKRSEGSPMMEGTLKALLDDLHSNLEADINSFKEEISGVSRHLHEASHSTEAHRDAIVRFQNGPDRQTLLMALQNKTPYDFEGHKLMFYPNLSRATLEWRRSLIWHNIPYKWSTPKYLLIPRDSGNLKIQEATENWDCPRLQRIPTTQVPQPHT